MSQTLTLARPYARAAFAVARDESALPAWSQALAFAAHVAVDPRVATLLGDPRLADADAVDPRVATLLGDPRLADADAVALLAPSDTGEGFGRFLSTLAGNRRLALLPEIAGLFEELRAEAERVVKARVTSASELPAGELDNLKAALRKRFGREVEVETAVDPSLIGGAVIDAGDVVIDGSLKGKLERLQTALAH